MIDGHISTFHISQIHHKQVPLLLMKQPDFTFTLLLPKTSLPIRSVVMNENPTFHITLVWSPLNPADPGSKFHYRIHVYCHHPFSAADLHLHGAGRYVSTRVHGGELLPPLATPALLDDERTEMFEKTLSVMFPRHCRVCTASCPL